MLSSLIGRFALRDSGRITGHRTLLIWLGAHRKHIVPWHFARPLTLTPHTLAETSYPQYPESRPVDLIDKGGHIHSEGHQFRRFLVWGDP